MSSKLAIFGGQKTRKEFFPSMSTIGQKEKEAVQRVMNRGKLSEFRGNFGENFLGGEEVRSLELEWATAYKAGYAIAVNSCTSALQIACGVIGLAPGDEVIVTPWSMSCSATAPLLWNAIPVFADIEPDFYCLDPKSVEERITERTKAIIVVDLFGHPYDQEINEIAKKHNLMVIEDAAQAIGAWIKKGNKYFPAGSLGDIGVFSFTQGKHLSAGEGGMIITDNERLAFRCRLLRNHAEAVINDMDYYQETRERFPSFNNNMLGFNMRMTELHAAIVREQLKKQSEIANTHVYNAYMIAQELRNIPAIETQKTKDDYIHSYYVQALKWDQSKADGIHRDKFIEAVKAELAPEKLREKEGVPIGCGYIKPLYLFPLFQDKLLYGGTSYPFSLMQPIHQTMNYKTGSCPTAEMLWKDKLFLHRILGTNLALEDINSFISAFKKVWKYRKELL